MKMRDTKIASIAPITRYFHSMRAVLALEGVDYKKHSGVIAHFRENYVKPGIFSKELSAIIGQAALIRNQSDYEDFFLVSAEDAEKQLLVAAEFYAAVSNYLQTGENQL
ncbi:HEPN domain-containing protein [Acutalibacter muris]|uniref:HEPN domain-containing protein n=1 Tax=Acutalibacter muris TaxID=1796620 RepID=UPI00202B26E9|nr:HEPN domain-containing protein [Acutalibacter muris]